MFKLWRTKIVRRFISEHPTIWELVKVHLDDKNFDELDFQFLLCELSKVMRFLQTSNKCYLKSFWKDRDLVKEHALKERELMKSIAQAVQADKEMLEDLRRMDLFFDTHDVFQEVAAGEDVEDETFWLQACSAAAGGA